MPTSIDQLQIGDPINTVCSRCCARTRHVVTGLLSEDMAQLDCTQCGCARGWIPGGGGSDLPNTDPRYVLLARRLGALVESKQQQYGDSVGKTGDIMRILYPDGIRPDQVDDALLVVRVLDKLSRISQRGSDGADLGGESPWMDIAGYGLLAWERDEPT